MSQPTLAPPAPALAEIEEALVPAPIVEKLEDDSSTVLVPSVPTPMAGAVYILPPERVHPVDVPFTTALRVFTKWGAGPVSSSEPWKRVSHPRPRRRPPDRPYLFTPGQWSSMRFGIGQKAVRNPVDSATASVFCALQQARLAVVGPLI
jgi:hypothetical protein